MLFTSVFFLFAVDLSFVQGYLWLRCRLHAEQPLLLSRSRSCAHAVILPSASWHTLGSHAFFSYASKTKESNNKKNEKQGNNTKQIHAKKNINSSTYVCVYIYVCVFMFGELLWASGHLSRLRRSAPRRRRRRRQHRRRRLWAKAMGQGQLNNNFD